MGSSSAILPCCTANASSVASNGLRSDATLNSELGVIGRRSGRSAKPSSKNISSAVDADGDGYPAGAVRRQQGENLILDDPSHGPLGADILREG